jgi:galactoside O-acetyltransferase
MRRLLVKGMFASCGRAPIFGRNLTLRHPDNTHVGDSVVLDDYCLVDARGAGEAGIRLADRVMINRGVNIQAKVGPISIGKDTGVGALSQIISQGPIEIGDNVSIASGAMIAGGRYDVELSPDAPEVKARFTGGPIVIGSNVRVGMGAVILDGVTIGENSIVAPGSVVYDNVPPDTIVIGNPARPLRQRKAATSTQQTQRELTVVMPVQEAPTEEVPAEKAPMAACAVPQEPGVRQVIRSYLEDTHFAEFGPGKLGDDDSLFDQQVIDSIGLVGLISMIEQQFNIEIADEDLVPEKLSTVSGLASIVTDKK